MDVFVQCAKIEKSLREGKSTTECLAWCAENKQSLRKQKVWGQCLVPIKYIHHADALQSTLEFELRLQQFIELVRSGRRKEATAHSKKFLAPHWDTHLNDIQRASGLLANPPNTPEPRYKVCDARPYTYFGHRLTCNNI